jgi:hypothetical protein
MSKSTGETNVPEGPVAKDDKRWVWWLLTVVVTAAVFPPVIFGHAPGKPDRVGGDDWRNVIEDFQTLITGIFAVGAAYLTVRQMQASDRKSDRRHQELVSLTLRSDALRVERLIVPNLGLLRTVNDDFRAAIGRHPCLATPMEVSDVNKEAASACILDLEPILMRTYGVRLSAS